MRSIFVLALAAAALTACTMPPDSTTASTQTTASGTASTTAAPSQSPSTSATPAPTPAPIAFSGTGNSGLQGPFHLNAGIHSFTGSQTGTGNFSVWLADSKGNDQDLIFNSTGAYSGTVKKAVATSGDYYLDVQFADGAWTAKVQ